MSGATDLVIPPPEAGPDPTSTAAGAAVAEPSRTLSAIAKRAASALMIQFWSLAALLARLPFPFPSDRAAVPSPKARYRSHYRCPGPAALLDQAKLLPMTPFQIVCHLVDFSGLRDELARVYRPSHKGQIPFDAVSLFLAICLRREHKLSWRKLAALLAGEEGAYWRALFGFEEGQTPSASGLRYFFRQVGPGFFDELCPRFIDLLRSQRLFPEESTFPGDPPGRGVTLSQDGMLHPARHQRTCQLVTDECYQPLPADQPATTPTDLDKTGNVASQQVPRRSCRAGQNGHEGCCCDSPDCAQQCRRASTLDPAARFLHYQGGNAKHGQPSAAKEATQGKDVFGYRSVAAQFLDDRFAVAWIARSYLYSANTDERSPFPDQLQALIARFPDLRIGEVLGDSGLGYAECLNALYDIGALRMIDLRGDKGDEDLKFA